MAKNGYAALVKQRSEGGTKRRALDDYETPAEVTHCLVEHFGAFKGPILEPACGSGRMSRELRALCGVQVKGVDIKQGPPGDFFKRTKRWAGDIVSNPPYRDGLADRFVEHALSLADGSVAMLMQSGFVWGGRRGAGLYARTPPELVIVMCERIYFFVDGEPITSQFFSHAWLCWPNRAKRERGKITTRMVWAITDSEF